MVIILSIINEYDWWAYMGDVFVDCDMDDGDKREKV